MVSINAIFRFKAMLVCYIFFMHSSKNSPLLLPFVKILYISACKSMFLILQKLGRNCFNMNILIWLHSLCNMRSVQSTKSVEICKYSILITPSSFFLCHLNQMKLSKGWIVWNPTIPVVQVMKYGVMIVGPFPALNGSYQSWRSIPVDTLWYKCEK